MPAVDLSARRSILFEKVGWVRGEGGGVVSERPEYGRGGVYHLYNRGAHRLSVFREPENYYFVLRKMKRYCYQFDLTPLAYCLLPNHYPCSAWVS